MAAQVGAPNYQSVPHQGQSQAYTQPPTSAKQSQASYNLPNSLPPTTVAVANVVPPSSSETAANPPASSVAQTVNSPVSLSTSTTESTSLPPPSSSSSSTSLSTTPYADYASSSSTFRTVTTPSVPPGNSNQEQYTSSSTAKTSSSGPSQPTNTANNNPQGPVQPHDNNVWSNLGHGTQVAIIMVLLVGIFAIILLSIWFCCGCCGVRRKRRKRVEARQSGVDTITTRAIPLHTVANRLSALIPRGDIPPPRYEEAVPPQHTTVAGGISHVREEETAEAAVVADGKTPLSEIPFEDVVLDHSIGEGSSRTFEDRHYGLGGDTTGHTNS